ncbi:kinase-like protein [Cubamyces menziesii]|nr:kinase-like protein [Cubamyces menziesii]
MSLAREKENRDSGVSTVTVTPATIATAAVARSARGNVVVSPVLANGDGRTKSASVTQDSDDPRSHSPNSAESHSSASSSSTSASLSMSTGTESASSDSRPQTLTTSETQEWRLLGHKPKGIGCVDSPEPSPRAASFAERGVFTVSVTSDMRDLDDDIPSARRPSIIIDHYLSATPTTESRPRTPVSPASTSSPSPLSPAPRYPGWLSAVVAPLKSFINDQVDPRDLYADLREIAEGESGSVYAARVLATPGSPEKEPGSFVAIKNVPILPSGSPKINDLRSELALMNGISHPHILTMDALYVDLVEDCLWIRMDLMERSLADVIAYADEGIIFHEKCIARVASDVLYALDYLQSKGIAHRDLRSDNLLVNVDGVVKLADFSSAVQVTRTRPTCTDLVGVAYWQAPEIRGNSGSYNALKVDVWSLGATVWELAQAEPPFSDITDPRQFGDTLPPLSQAEVYSRSFHDFLHLCSKASSSRPDPHELLSTPFIRNPSGRQAIADLLADCRAVEERMSRRQSADSTGTVSRS